MNREQKREYWRKNHNNPKMHIGTWQEFNSGLFHQTPIVGKK